MQIDRPITIAIILFVILLLVFFLVFPEYKMFGTLQTDLGEKKAEFNAEFDYYAAITKAYFDLQGRKDDVKKIDDALPSNADFGELIYFFQKAAAENGIMIKNLFLSKSSPTQTQSGFQSESQTNQDKKVKDVTFSMDLLGDYKSLNNFIISLENSSRIFEVTNISFGSADQSGGQGISSFNLQVKTYSY